MKFSDARFHALPPLVVAAAAVLLGSTRCGPGRADAADLPVTTRAWDGFGDDFDPHWYGDTERVQWSRYYSSSGVMVTNGLNNRVNFGGGLVYRDKPIELIRSERSASVDTQAKSVVPGDSATAKSSDSPSSTSEGRWSTKRAQFAEVVDLDNPLLASGRAVAEHTSDVADTFFTLDGRVLAGSLIDTVDRTTSSASAAASSLFATDYLVTHPVSFDLSGTLSGGGNVAYNFTLRNATTGELIYRLTPNDFPDSGLSYDFSVSGEFEPGIYKFYLSAASKGSINTAGDYDPGDLGEFSLDFSAAPIGAFVPTAALPAAATFFVPEPVTLVLVLGLLPLGSRVRR